MGIGNTASGIGAFALGIGANAGPGQFAIALGSTATATNDYGVAIGRSATVTNVGSIYIHDGATPSSNFSPANDTAANQLMVACRGGAQLNTGRVGLRVSDKNGVAAATIIDLTNGVVYANRGFYSQSKNLLAPATISVGASPFSWTNYVSTAGTNVFVFVDGSGVTGSVAINGTTIYSALAGADATIPLQPGEYVTVTYTIGTPVMFWKPF